MTPGLPQLEQTDPNRSRAGAIADLQQRLAALERGRKLTEKWHVVGSGGSEPAFGGTGWTNYGAPFEGVEFMIDAMGFVHLRGTAKSGTLGNPIFVLPAGYLPPASVSFPSITGAGSTEVVVDSAGNVTPNGGSNLAVSLNAVCFSVNA